MFLYSLLLRLYPSSFRNEYGGEMRAILAKRHREASSFGGVVAVWSSAIADIISNAPRLHWEMLQQDVGYTLRTLRRTPAFTLTVVLVSALGIGATTAAFSIADHVLVRPLPYADADRLVKLWQNQSFRGYSRLEVAPPNFVDWQRQSRSFEHMAAYTGLAQNMSGDMEPVKVEGTWATGELFMTLGAQAALGRIFLPSDLAENAPGVMVLSDRLWRERFNTDPNVLGRQVRLSSAPYVIVGVMPPGFYFPRRDTDYWVPMPMVGSGWDDRTNYMLEVIARLAPGVTMAQAQSEADVIAANLQRAYPKENGKTGIGVYELRSEINQQTRMLLMALIGAALCVLLIACTNLASLLLSRALARQRELAVRAAIGAGRERLLRQMVTEGLVLAILGGAAGLALAVVAGPLFARLVPTNLPISQTPGIDLRILALAAATTLMTGLGFAVLPAWRASRQVNAEGLRDSGRVGASRHTERLRSSLIVAQVSASIVLLVSSGLLIRALWEVQHRDPGFRAEGVLSLGTSLPVRDYASVAVRGTFYRRVLSEIRALPGVSAVAYTTALPMVWRAGIWPAALDGAPLDPTDPRVASIRYVTPGYFQTVGVPLLRGRDVSESDAQDRPFVVVISESFAKNYWPGQDPIGRTLEIAFSKRTVIGIVGDVRVRGLERTSEPQVYFPYAQVADDMLVFYAPKNLAVRSSQSAEALMPSIREIIRRADPLLPISDVHMLSEIVNGDTAPRQVQVSVLGAFAAVALLLAGVGIHGLLAFVVSTRAREIGVRMALGASGSDVLRMILRQGLMLATAGAVVGVALAFAAGRAMQALLAGVSPADIWTFAIGVAFVFVMTMLGSIPPAVRASRVDPTTAMRAE